MYEKQVNEEIWKDIPGFKGYYQASSLGNIRRIGDCSNQCAKWKSDYNVLKQKDNGHGYKRVTLSVNNKHYDRYVHRLVALTFIDNPNNYNEINHKDGNKENNRVENLEWCTHSQNGKHAYRIGLRTVKGCYGALKKKVAQVDATTNKVIKVFDSIDYAAKEVGCGHAIITCCCWYAEDKNHYNGRKYLRGSGYKWRFATGDMKVGDVIDG